MAVVKHKPPIERDMRVEIIASHIKEILETLGEELREGLEDTPNRVARMMMDELYTNGDPLDLELNALFAEEAISQDMVVVENIPFNSWCEHHMVPYVGVAHVGYVPIKQYVGLSKIARLVKAAGRGLTIQERVTARIADAIENKLHPQGVMVVIEATHMCMVCRGARATGSRTTTSAVRGLFKESDAARAEFLSLVRGLK